MNKIFPIILSDQSNYKFIWDSLYVQSLATFLDNSPLQERSSRRTRRYFYMAYDYEHYVPMNTVSSRRNRRLFDNTWDEVYFEKYNIQSEEAWNKERITWKSFIPSLSSIIDFSKSLFDKEFWKKIYTSKNFREGLKDWFTEMIQDYTIWPIIIIGIVYLYTLI